MTTVIDQQDLTVIMDRNFAVPGRELYLRFASHLAQRGFYVQQAEPPAADVASEEFSGGLRAQREVVLDGTRRQVGKWLLAMGVILLGITLGVIVSGEERRWVLEWMLTIEVLGGGYGLMLLKNPPDRRRTVLDLTLTGEPGGTHVVAREGVGRVEDGQVYQWSDVPELAITEGEIEAMASDEAEQ